MDTIASNPFYKVMFDQTLAVEDKRDRIAKKLSTDAADPATKTACAEDMKQLLSHLNGERKKLATEFILQLDNGGNRDAIDGLQSVNNGMQNVYAVLAEACKKTNPGDIASDIHTDVMRTYSDLTSQAVRIKQLRDSSGGDSRDILKKMMENGMMLTEPVKVRRKPLQLRYAPGATA